MVSFLINFILAREVEEYGNIRLRDKELWVRTVVENGIFSGIHGVHWPSGWVSPVIKLTQSCNHMDTFADSLEIVSLGLAG